MPQHRIYGNHVILADFNKDKLPHIHTSHRLAAFSLVNDTDLCVGYKGEAIAHIVLTQNEKSLFDWDNFIYCMPLHEAASKKAWAFNSICPRRSLRCWPKTDIFLEFCFVCLEMWKSSWLILILLWVYMKLNFAYFWLWIHHFYLSQARILYIRWLKLPWTVLFLIFFHARFCFLVFSILFPFFLPCEINLSHFFLHAKIFYLIFIHYCTQQFLAKFQRNRF